MRQDRAPDRLSRFLGGLACAAGLWVMADATRPVGAYLGLGTPVGLGLVPAVLHWPIDERPAARLRMAGAVIK